MRDGVLGQNRHSIRGDQFRDTMIDFRIYMIWTARQDNALTMVFFHPSKNLVPFFLNIFLCLQQFFPGLIRRSADLWLRKSVFLTEHLTNSIQKYFEGPHGEEGMFKTYLQAVQIFDVIFDVFRITGHNRTVIMIIRVRGFISLKSNTGIEDKRNPLID